MNKHAAMNFDGLHRCPILVARITFYAHKKFFIFFKNLEFFYTACYNIENKNIVIFLG